jgi:hypothetical protein
MSLSNFKNSSILAWFICAAFLIVFLVLAWPYLSAFWEKTKSISPEIYVPLTVVVLTAIFGLMATFLNQRHSRKQLQENAFRERKVEIYLDFLKIVETVLVSQKPEISGTPLDQGALALKLIEFRTKAVLWASPEVLKCLDNFTKLQVRKDIDLFQVLEDMQREMRNDLGLSNIGLGTDFFAKLSLSDPEDLERIRGKPQQL